MFFYFMLCNQSRESSDCTNFLPSSATADVLVFFLKFRTFEKQIFPIVVIQFFPVTLISKLGLSFKQPRPSLLIQFLPRALISKL